MARPLGLEFADALYHVTSREDGKEDVYFCDEDRRLFLNVLDGVHYTTVSRAIKRIETREHTRLDPKSRRKTNAYT